MEILMKIIEIEGHEPSYLPDGEWKLAWADEFDGDMLDRTKWDFRLNFWGERFDAYTDKGVIVRNGCVELHRTEIDGKYVSPQLQTGSNSFDFLSKSRENPWEQDGIWPLEPLEAPKFVHRFGYYECRCKFQKDPTTMWSAFWTQSPSIGARFEPEWCGVESDIMEYFKPGVASTGNICGGYGKQYKTEGRNTYPLRGTEDGWHYFGMDWRPDGYTFYCDGEVTTRAIKYVSQIPQFILLTTEIQGYRSVKSGKVKALGGVEIADYPFIIKDKFEDDAFIVDHVRVFDKVN